MIHGHDISAFEEMTCDCCGKCLGWGGSSYEGHDLVCDYCAENCYPEQWANRDKPLDAPMISESVRQVAYTNVSVSIYLSGPIVPRGDIE